VTPQPGRRPATPARRSAHPVAEHTRRSSTEVTCFPSTLCDRWSLQLDDPYPPFCAGHAVKCRWTRDRADPGDLRAATAPHSAHQRSVVPNAGIVCPHTYVLPVCSTAHGDWLSGMVIRVRGTLSLPNICASPRAGTTAASSADQPVRGGPQRGAKPYGNSPAAGPGPGSLSITNAPAVTGVPRRSRSWPLGRPVRRSPSGTAPPAFGHAPSTEEQRRPRV
jgi:hypothetical protein